LLFQVLAVLFGDFRHSLSCYDNSASRLNVAKT